MGSKDSVAKHVTVKRNFYSLRICGFTGRWMGDEELDPVCIGVNNKTVIAFNRTSTYLFESENFNPLLTNQIKFISSKF